VFDRLLSVRMEELAASNWTVFDEILCLVIFRKSAEKFQLSLKSDKNDGHVT